MKQKNDWHLWGEWPIIAWFHSCYNAGLALELKRRSGVALSQFAAEYKEGVQKLYLLEHEWKEGGVRYLHEIVRNPSKLEHDLRAIERAADALSRLNAALNRLHAEKFSRATLVQWYLRFHAVHHELWCAGMVPNLLELNQSYLSSYLRSALEKARGKTLSQEDWQTLITPIDLSSVQKEERAFLQFVISIEKKKKLVRALLHCGDDVQEQQHVLRADPSAWRMLVRHHQRFCWIQYGWTGPALTVAYYVDLLVRFLREKQARSLLQKTLASDKTHTKHQQRLEKVWARNPKYRVLLHLLRQLLFMKVVRMDALFEAYASVEPVLRELAKHFSLSMNQIYMIYPPQMARLTKATKPDFSFVNEAQHYSAFMKEGNHLRFYVGEKAKKKMAPILAALPKEKKVRELKGDIGYPGKVRGIVKIIATAKDMGKMEEGNILVSHATDPSVLPAMKLAAAFVTDLGGLTAHAAIVAREMKKPCIVGTKMATRIFKDGDKVEVDAERGIVRKI